MLLPYTRGRSIFPLGYDGARTQAITGFLEVSFAGKWRAAMFWSRSFSPTLDSTLIVGKVHQPKASLSLLNVCHCVRSLRSPKASATQRCCCVAPSSETPALRDCCSQDIAVSTSYSSWRRTERAHFDARIRRQREREERERREKRQKERERETPR